MAASTWDGCEGVCIEPPLFDRRSIISSLLTRPDSVKRSLDMADKDQTNGEVALESKRKRRHSVKGWPHPAIAHLMSRCMSQSSSYCPYSYTFRILTYS